MASVAGLLPLLAEDPDLFLCVQCLYLPDQAEDDEAHEISIVQALPGGRTIRPARVNRRFRSHRRAYQRLCEMIEDGFLISFGLVDGWGELYRTPCL